MLTILLVCLHLEEDLLSLDVRSRRRQRSAFHDLTESPKHVGSGEEEERRSQNDGEGREG